LRLFQKIYPSRENSEWKNWGKTQKNNPTDTGSFGLLIDMRVLVGLCACARGSWEGRCYRLKTYQKNITWKKKYQLKNIKNIK